MTAWQRFRRSDWAGVTAITVGVIVFVLVTAGGAAYLTRDDPPLEPAGAQGLTTLWVDTIDGRRIPCVLYRAGNRGGLTCDWSHQ